MSNAFDPSEQITGVEVNGQPTAPPPPAAASPALAPGGGSPLAQPSMQDRAFAGMESWNKTAAADEAAGEAKLGPMREKYLSVLNSPSAAQAHLKEVQEQPKPEDYQKGAKEFVSAMAVVGAIFGRGSRNAGNAALNAFAGAVKGWQSGNLEAYTNATKEWEQASKKTVENNQIELDRYKAIIEDKNLNIDQQAAAINLVSSEMHNKVMFDFSMSKNYTGYLNTYDKQNAANVRLDLAVKRSQELDEKSQAPLKAELEDIIADPNKAALLSETEWAKVKGYADSHGIQMPDHTQVREIGVPRSAPAMAVKQFKDEFTQKNGRPPTAKEITDFSASYTGEVSEARTVGTRAGNISVSSEEAANTFPLALEASKAMPRGKFVPLNKLYLMGQEATSNPAYRQFMAANEAAITAYAATMSRSGANTVKAQSRAQSILSTADSPQAYAAGIAQLQKEIGAVRKAPGQALKQLFGNEGGSESAGGWKVEKVQ